MISFEVGKTYSASSACNHECVWYVTILKRTAKTISFKDLHSDKIITRRVRNFNDCGIESCLFLGDYSMAPTIMADEVAA